MSVCQIIIYLSIYPPARPPARLSLSLSHFLSRIFSLWLAASLYELNLVNVSTHSTRLDKRLGWLFQADASSEKLLLDDMKKAQVNVMDVVVLLFLELRS